MGEKKFCSLILGYIFKFDIIMFYLMNFINKELILSFLRGFDNCG